MSQETRLAVYDGENLDDWFRETIKRIEQEVIEETQLQQSKNQAEEFLTQSSTGSQESWTMAMM